MTATLTRRRAAYAPGRAAAPALTAVAWFGDSFTAGGTNGDATSVRYATKTSTLLGVTELNFGIGGARQNLARPAPGPDILTQIYQAAQPPSAAPYTPMYQCAVIQASINNLNLNTVHADLSIVTSALLRGVHRIRAGGAYECYPQAGNPRWAFTGGAWSDVPTVDANTGAGVERAFGNGYVATLITPADFPGGTLRVYGPKAQGFGAIETFTLDAGAQGSVDNRNAALQTGSQAWEKALTVGSGAHTIKSTTSSTNSVDSVNGADFEVTGKPPPVIVLNTARSPNYPGGEHAIIDADVTASNAAVSAAVGSEFPSDPRVVLFDLDALLAKNPANFGADGVHPSSTGTTLIANALKPVILAAVAA